MVASLGAVGTVLTATDDRRPGQDPDGDPDPDGPDFFPDGGHLAVGSLVVGLLMMGTGYLIMRADAPTPALAVAPPSP